MPNVASVFPAAMQLCLSAWTSGHSQECRQRRPIQQNRAGCRSSSHLSAQALATEVTPMEVLGLCLCQSSVGTESAARTSKPEPQALHLALLHSLQGPRGGSQPPFHKRGKKFKRLGLGGYERVCLSSHCVSVLSSFLECVHTSAGTEEMRGLRLLQRWLYTKGFFFPKELSAMF